MSEETPRRGRLYWTLWRARFAMKWRARAAWLIVTGRGIERYPDRLDSYEGEPPHFVRRDLASTPDEVQSLLYAEWGYKPYDLPDYPLSVEPIWMRESVQNDNEDEDSVFFFVVPEGSIGAVPYWKAEEA
jgi:hypothetical protein